TNPNFPFVVLGRAVSHYQALRARTHARREPLDLDALRAQAAKTFDDAAVRRRLGGTFTTLARRGSVNAETRQALIDAIETLLETAEAAG
ncbi:MAG: DUF3482 domain-containing protein, partial [Gammaproteobacteria bacterium]|nr:DUF3482 domain-containing protein [Gammaproteobacteria bacterium]